MFRERLEVYLRGAVDDGAHLLCQSAAICRSSTGGRGEFASGQLSHVGTHYAAKDQQGLRILVVGKQTGRGHEHVTMDQRSEQVASAKSLAARSYPRTPHMEGTAAALKVLLGLPTSADTTADDYHRGVHVFDRFALVNATLCSHIPNAGDARGQGTPVMYERCSRHLRRTIELLEPTVIIAQGWTATGASPSSVVATALRTPRPPKNTHVVVPAAHGEVVFAALVHPSLQWPSPRSTRFKDDIEPMLRRVRADALRCDDEGGPAPGEGAD